MNFLFIDKYIGVWKHNLTYKNIHAVIYKESKSCSEQKIKDVECNNSVLYSNYVNMIMKFS